MAATLLNTAQLAQDQGFQSRVQAAMITAALNVAAEAVAAQDNPTYMSRHNLAFAILNAPQNYVNRFAWATAANVTVSADLQSPVAIASSTAAFPAQVTTAAVHGLATGDVVEISNHSDLVKNGTYPVTVVSTTAFTILVVGTAAGTATGQVQKMPPDADIQFAVNSDFSDIAGVGVLT